MRESSILTLMMKRSIYTIDSIAKRALAVLLLSCVAGSAWSATSASAPLVPLALPALPSVPMPKTPASPGAASPQDVANVLAGLPNAEKPNAAPPAKKDNFSSSMKPSGQDSAANPLADLPPPPPESSETTAPAATNLAAAPAVPNILGDAATPPPMNFDLPLPPAASFSGATSSNAVALPEINVEAEKPKVKTWQTVLAPTVKPPETHSNYRRTLLPSTIYRASYNAANKHLPKLTTRQDYENLLFTSASKNDVETTRALLNAGTNINVLASNGETPLAAARRSGAMAVTELLMARGGR